MDVHAVTSQGKKSDVWDWERVRGQRLGGVGVRGAEQSMQESEALVALKMLKLDMQSWIHRQGQLLHVLHLLLRACL